MARRFGRRDAPPRLAGSERHRRACPAAASSSPTATPTCIAWSPDGRIAEIADLDADDLAVAPDGSVLIADHDNARIERIGTDGGLTVVDRTCPTATGRLTSPRCPTAASSTPRSERVTRVRPDGSTFVLAGAGPFIRTAPDGLQQRLSGQSAQRADLHYVFDLAATPDGGVLISHGRIDAFDEGGFVDYVAPRGARPCSARRSCATATASSRPAACRASPSR